MLGWRAFSLTLIVERARGLAEWLRLLPISSQTCLEVEESDFFSDGTIQSFLHITLTVRLLNDGIYYHESMEQTRISSVPILPSVAR